MLAVMCGAMIATPASAQLTSTINGIQTRITADPNGVDLVTGSFNFQRTDLTFGPNARTRLSLVTQQGPGAGDNYSGQIYLKTEGTQNYVYAIHGNRTEKFLVSGSTYISVSGNGAALAQTGTNTYVLTERSGVRIEYYYQHYTYTGYYHGSGTISYINYILYPDNEKLTLSMKMDYLTWCEDFSAASASAATEVTAGERVQPEAALIPPGTCFKQPVWRVQSITSNLGYQLRFTYAAEAVPPNSSDSGNFHVRTSAKAVNLAIDYCDPAASSCTYTRTWPTLTYTGGGYTDPLGGQWSISGTYSGTTQTVSITRPSSSTPYIVATLTNSKVSSVQSPNGTWQYSYSDSGTTRTTTVTDPFGHTRIVVSNLTTGLVTSDTNGAGKTTSYLYDSNGRVTRVTYPEGNYTQYTYDARGNITEARQVSKTPGTPPDIVTTASYPATCSNILTCNKPVWTRDARNQQTDYTYDPTHGGVLTVTAPAPTAGAVRPQVRYTYSPLQAWYKNASGVLAASGSPVYSLTTVSACRTTASCSGAADEGRTTIAYEAGSSAVKSNLLPKTVSKGTGTAPSTSVTTLGYDEFNNLTTVDGPQAGTADTTVAFYNLLGQQTGEIGPSSSSYQNLAKRITYDTGERPYLVEQGYTSGQTASALAGMTVIGSQVTAYDSGDRPLTVTLKGTDGVAYALTQTTYNVAGQVSCVATRMNPASYGSLPASACTLGTQGSYGPDRITSYHYDAVGRADTVTTGYGTSDAATEKALTFTNNGQVSTVKDAQNNCTQFEYDGFDRLIKAHFPSSTVGATCSLTGDYEQYGFDANGNVTSFRTRRGETLTLSYDNLNQLILKDVPARSGLASTHTRDVYFGYDLFGDMTYARFDSAAGEGINFTFDALGRQLTETQALDGASRTLTSGYDAANSRTQLTFPDGNYVYNVTDIYNRPYVSYLNGSSPLIHTPFDNAGRPSTTYRWRPGGSWDQYTSYAYDNASRLQYYFLNPAGTTYDANGSLYYNPGEQITSRTLDNDAYAWIGQVNVSRAYTANGLNQYSTVGGSSFAYDLDGNLTSDGTNSYVYDVENRLVSRSGGGVSATLRYDPLGRLYEVNGSTTGITRFLYDGDDLVGEYNSSGTLLRRYAHGTGAGDDPLVWFEGSGVADSARHYLFADERGSIVAVTDASGVINNINSYDEYGIPDDPSIATRGRFRYTGQAWLPELGMYYYKARMYSPTLGRFMQTDPIGYGDGMNMYRYVGNDPVNGVDPSGLMCVVTYRQTWAVTRDIKTGVEISRTLVSQEAIGYSGCDANPSHPGRGEIDDIPRGQGHDPQNDENAITVTANRATRWYLNNVVDPYLDGTQAYTDFMRGPYTDFMKNLFLPCCFTAGTLIDTPSGQRAIETLKVGDLVISRDPQTGKTAAKPIVSVTPAHERRIWAVTVSYRDDEGHWHDERYEATDDHPWRTADDQWVVTGSLKSGQLLAREDGTAVVAEVVDTGSTKLTYNLEVADFHTYFVGKAETWVHNSCPTPGQARQWLSNRNFRNWFHKVYKAQQNIGGPNNRNDDMDPEDIEDAWMEWNERGRPRV